MKMCRRSFIQYASLAAAGQLAGFRPFAQLNALAQVQDQSYKALVCIFLYGGNDANNTLVPFAADAYANYAALRGPLALPQNQLLQLASLPGYGLHNSLPEVRQLIDSGVGALVANVGTIVQPTTRSTMSVRSSLPDNLFSHSDQQLQWQNAAQTAAGNTGWAGRMSDLLGGRFNSSASIPMITSVTGDTVFCDGQSTSPLSVIPGNPTGVACGEGAAECSVRQNMAQSFLTFSGGLSLVQAQNALSQNAYQYANVLSQALSGMAPLATVFPANNPFASQLQQIAQLMQVRNILGVNRQVFFAGVGNFDTHANQLGVQSLLLRQFSTALYAFYQATRELGIDSQVTTFTMSDFSRAFEPNANNGCDHGWGGHHLVVGGAVKGARLYGTFPTLALGGPDDSGSTGRWIPTTASVQYAATLASWFGVPPSQLATVFPTLGSFVTTNLGFL
jgi:uncharacterized protein (DUF1501 family)